MTMHTADTMEIVNSAEAADLLHPLIRLRRSPRAFDSRPVEPAVLRSVLEAARWAPSANNKQPWHFIVATKGTPAHERMIEILMDGNKRWAHLAPVLMLVVAEQYTDREGRPTQRSLYDVGLAMGNLTAQATALGLSVHQMGGFYPDRAREEFGIPEGYEPVVVAALGYRGDPALLPDDLRERELAPRTRKPLDAFVFEGAWPQA